MVTLANFTFPPTDGSVPPDVVVDFHIEHNPTHIFAILHDVNGSSQIDITCEQLARAVHRTAYILNPSGIIQRGTIMAFLISTSTIEYVILLLGAMRAGLVPFPISPRVPIPGIAHLITSTRTSRILVGGSKFIDDLTSELKTSLHESSFATEFIQLPALQDILSGLEPGHHGIQVTHKPFPSLQRLDSDSIFIILHSSGSTGFPKPIKWHMDGLFKNVINQPLAWEYTGSGLRVGTMALPTFHAMGALLQILQPLYTGYTQVWFAPSQPPVVPTSALTIQVASKTKCLYLICVPTYLETWAQDENHIADLREMKGIIFAGSPLPDIVWNKLLKRGVQIYPMYGGTEFGIINEIHDRDNPKAREYIKISSKVEARFLPQHDGDDSHELVFVNTKDHNLFVTNADVDGRLAYKTQDLFVRHPQEPNLWKFVGRLDDQIVLLNGEKTNPVRMEAEIMKCPIVRYALIFGQGRNQTGVLIELQESVNHVYGTEGGRTRLLGEIWPYVERANKSSFRYSRLVKSAVIFVDPAHPLPRTSKGSISRATALKHYAVEIDKMYEALEKGYDSESLDGIKPPESWADLTLVETWVKRCVTSVLGWEVDVAGDFFQQGMDSLTATMLLRAIKSALVSPFSGVHKELAAEKINLQAIFDNPTVRQLAELLVWLNANANTHLCSPAKMVEEIHAMIEKYNSGWPQNRPINSSSKTTKEESIVVTGTTGGLGSHILAQLLASEKVQRVWAMNRKSSVDNMKRHLASFQDKSLNAELLESKKLVLLDIDFEDAKLGLQDEMYNTIRKSVSIIIHNAWPVNFNLSLRSFEPSIRGTRNLLDLALSSSGPIGLPRFAFISSVAVVGFSSPGRSLDEVSINPEEAATSIGYGQAKLVVEKLVESARNANLPSCIIRLGQQTGDKKSGSWNTTDWVPSLISSSLTIGSLPAAVGTVSWLPLDITAHSIIDVCTARDVNLSPIIHVAHQRPVAWMDLMSAFSVVLAPYTKAALPSVEFNEWLKRVNECAKAFQGPEAERYKRFPSTKIQNLLEIMAQADKELRTRSDVGDVESVGVVRLSTHEIGRMSGALRNASELGQVDVEKWVEYWRMKGLLFSELM